MLNFEPWALALFILACIIVGMFLLWRVALLLAPELYRAMIQNNSISVDDFVGGAPSPKSALKSWLLNRFNVGSRVAKKEGYVLKTEDSDKVPGLKVTSRGNDSYGIRSSQNCLCGYFLGTGRRRFQSRNLVS